MATVSIIVLNWKGYADTIECVKSLQQINFDSPYHITVIDNGSPEEESTRLFSALCNMKLRDWSYCHHDRNLGFTAANNMAIVETIKIKKPSFILLLNNDTVVNQNFLTQMVMQMRDHCVGIVQAKMLNYYRNDKIDSTGHVLHWGMVKDRNAGENDTDNYTAMGLIGASGAAALYRASMIDNIGLFDSRFFNGYEDSEYSWRAWKRGWKTAYANNAIIYHKRGASVNRMQILDPDYLNGVYSYAALPCKIHGTTTQKFQFCANMVYTAGVSEVGYLSGRNTVGAKPYLIALAGMFSDKNKYFQSRIYVYEE
jgi:hypothetical protein